MSHHQACGTVLHLAAFLSHATSWIAEADQNACELGDIHVAFPTIHVGTASFRLDVDRELTKLGIRNRLRLDKNHYDISSKETRQSPAPGEVPFLSKSKSLKALIMPCKSCRPQVMLCVRGFTCRVTASVLLDKCLCLLWPTRLCEHLHTVRHKSTALSAHLSTSFGISFSDTYTRKSLARSAAILVRSDFSTVTFKTSTHPQRQ